MPITWGELIGSSSLYEVVPQTVCPLTDLTALPQALGGSSLRVVSWWSVQSVEVLGFRPLECERAQVCEVGDSMRQTDGVHSN